MRACLLALVMILCFPFLEAQATPLQVPQPKKVRCRGEKGHCFQYNKEEHAKLLKALVVGVDAINKTQMLKESHKLAKAQLDAEKGNIIRLVRLWSTRVDNLKAAHEKVLKYNLGVIANLKEANQVHRDRNKRLKKDLEGQKLTNRIVFWTAVGVVAVLGGLAGYAIGHMQAK